MMKTNSVTNAIQPISLRLRIVAASIVSIGGVALLFLPPKHGTVQCPAYRARVTIDTTYIPKAGPASTSHGEADVLVDDTKLPCDADGVVEPS